ncbi:MAG TPA: ABC transporter substrate-binding protein [Bacillota bacterium]
MSALRRTRGAAALLLILALLAVAGCGGGGGDTGGAGDDGAQTGPSTGETPAETPAAGDKGGTIVIGRTGGVDSLDPARTVSGPSHEVFRLIFDTLVRRDPDGGFEGELAESWEASDDGLTWTFHLRQDRVFSNGNPVNADAVVFTFERMLDPDQAAPAAGFLGPISAVEKVDDYTVRFVMGEPFALLLDNLAVEYFGIVDPQAVEELGEDFGRNPVGSGPFVLKEWVTGERIVLEPNPLHKTSRSDVENQGPPHLDQLIFREIPQVETQIAGLRSGEINLITNMPAEQAVTFENDPNFQVMRGPGGINIAYLSFAMVPAADGGTNTFKPPFDDLRVRQAVAHAIDADTILETVLYGFGVRNKTPLPVGVFGHDPSLGDLVPDYDPERAGQLLDEAGWTMGSDGVRRKDGRPLAINFWSLNLGSAPQIAQIIQNQLEQVGFDVEITSLDVATYVSQAASGNLDLEMLDQGWSAPNILNIMTSMGWALGLYNNPELQDLLTRAQSEVDDAQRAALYRQAQQVMLEDMALVPLYTGTVPMVARSEVQGIKFDTFGQPLFHDAYVAP